MAALAMPVLLGIGALAIDLAWLRVVRAELQNAADAAALAGAQPLITMLPTSTQWAAAEQQAQQAVTLNRAARAALQTGQVQTGYWNPQQAGATLQPLPHTPGAQEVPAVRVTIRRADGHNGGPVQTFLAQLLRQPMVALSATATAARVPPGTAVGVLPIAMKKCLFDQYWDSHSRPPGPRKDADGQPFLFDLRSVYHSSGCVVMQWSSLSPSPNQVKDVREMISHGYKEPISVGDEIWLHSGTIDTLYSTVENCSDKKSGTCSLGVIPVLDTMSPGGTGRIQAFACLRILGTGKDKSERWITVQMSTACPPIAGTGIGPYYGLKTPPRLMQ